MKMFIIALKNIVMMGELSLSLSINRIRMRILLRELNQILKVRKMESLIPKSLESLRIFAHGLKQKVILKKAIRDSAIKSRKKIYTN